MNKNIIYICIAALVGLLAGYFIFGSSNVTQQDQHKHQEETANQMWTCSMHPQIMQPEPGDCPICGMNLIPATKEGEGETTNEFKLTKKAIALANIQTTIVGDQMINDNTHTLSGKIIENEESNATQSSYFEGRIERLYVNYKGQQIKKGQKLALIYAPDLIAAQQELITSASLKESQPILYKAVRNKLRLWKLSENQIKAIESSSKIQENFPVYATVSGTVSEIISADGDYIKKGQPLLRVSDLNTVWAEFDIYENQISQFKKEQRIRITTNAYPDKEFEAKISFIDPVLNKKTRTIRVRATLNNKDGILKPGMFVSGNVLGIEISKRKLTIPSSAVLWTGKRSVVYKKTSRNEPIFEMKEVVLDDTGEDTYTILEGLEHGDEIVTNGTFTVDAAAQLQGKKSMMNRSENEIIIPNKDFKENKIKLPKPVKKSLLSTLTFYLKMKDAFVESNTSQVSIHAKSMTKKLKEIQTSEIGIKNKKHLITSLEMLEEITKKNDIENQRAHFIILSESMLTLLSRIDSIEQIIYVQKCPMANTNKGAIWISTEKEIRNPYFGDAMLTCGSIIDTIQ